MHLAVACISLIYADGILCSIKINLWSWFASFPLLHRENELPRTEKEKRRHMSIASTGGLCPVLAALPKPPQGLLCWSGCQAGGYQARPDPLAPVLLGVAERRPWVPEDPATEGSSGMCHEAPTSPEHCGAMSPCIRKPNLLMSRFLTRIPEPGTHFPQLLSAFLGLWMKQNPASAFPGTHHLPSHPRIERGWPLLLQRKQTEGQRQGSCPRMPWQPRDPGWAAGREGAAHAMTVSTKAHFCASINIHPSSIHSVSHLFFFSSRNRQAVLLQDTTDDFQKGWDTSVARWIHSYAPVS